MFEKVLSPLMVSDLAAWMAIELINSLGSELYVVHVGLVPSIYSVPESTMLDPDFQ